ncbi:MAG: prepilin-type N-terminal cleavage/methylation domain-containing protein [Deltaproteobacteria bacterium]|nr:prepilin-type N-terminal cleavage/methylation domain-containing protein [Deltaproteobacteria bacterium]
MNLKIIIADKNGLTLIELMIVMVLSLILMGAVYMAYQTQQISSQVQYQTSALQSELRVALDIMQMDIVNAGCDRCATDTNSVQGIGINSGPTILELAMNYDTCVAPALYSPYWARYQLSGGEIWRTDSDLNNDVIIQNITTFGLTYTDQNGNDITSSPLGANAGNVYYVQINITVHSPDVDTTTGNPITRTLSRTVAVRNAGM